MLSGIPILENTRVCSIDSCQGSEAEVIIISFVRSNASKNVGFVRNYQRLNVALTRAKHALYNFGDVSTLLGSQSEDLRGLVNHSKATNCLVSSQQFFKTLKTNIIEIGTKDRHRERKHRSSTISSSLQPRRQENWDFVNVKDKQANSDVDFGREQNIKESLSQNTGLDSTSNVEIPSTLQSSSKTCSSVISHTTSTNTSTCTFTSTSLRKTNILRRLTPHKSNITNPRLSASVTTPTAFTRAGVVELPKSQAKHEKGHDFRHKERERPSMIDRLKHKGRDRLKDGDRDRDRSRDRRHSRDRDFSDDRHRSRHRDSYSDKYRSRDRDNNRGRHRDRSRDRAGSRDSYSDKYRSRDRDNNRGRHRDRSRDRAGSRDRDRSRATNRLQNRDPSEDRDKHRNRQRRDDRDINREKNMCP
eukprot:Awhi_evm1s4037